MKSTRVMDPTQKGSGENGSEGVPVSSHVRYIHRPRPYTAANSWRTQHRFIFRNYRCFRILNRDVARTNSRPWVMPQWGGCVQGPPIQPDLPFTNPIINNCKGESEGKIKHRLPWTGWWCFRVPLTRVVGSCCCCRRCGLGRTEAWAPSVRTWPNQRRSTWLPGMRARLINRPAALIIFLLCRCFVLFLRGRSSAANNPPLYTQLSCCGAGLIFFLSFIFFFSLSLFPASPSFILSSSFLICVFLPIYFFFPLLYYLPFHPWH